MARRRPPVVHGILAVNKPLGISSRAVVNRASRLLGERRCGHAGTLDPDASGVLVLAFGRATKTIRWLTEGHKTYAASVRFGTATHTDDAQGDTIRSAPMPDPWSLEAIDRAAQVGVGGDIAQVPPAVSALKQDGVRDYERVRRGEVVQRDARQVRLDAVRVTAVYDAVVECEVDCGPGFYVRAWARDLGERLHSAAHLCALQRLQSSGFSVDQCVDLDALELLELPERRARLLPLEIALELALPTLQVDAETTVYLVDGKRPAAPSGAAIDVPTLIMGPDDLAVCVATVVQEDDGLVFRVVRGLREDGVPAFRAMLPDHGAAELSLNP